MSDSEDRAMLDAVRALLLDECNEVHPDGPQKYGQIENPNEGDAQRLAEIAEAVGGVGVFWDGPKSKTWPTGFYEKK
jgi:hypothetical protein